MFLQQYGHYKCNISLVLYWTLLIELAQAWTFSFLSCRSFSISFISNSFSCFSFTYFASFPFLIIYLLSFLLFFYIYFDPLPSFPLFLTLIFALLRFIVSMLLDEAWKHLIKFVWLFVESHMLLQFVKSFIYFIHHFY